MSEAYKKSGRKSIGFDPRNDEAFVNKRSLTIPQTIVGTLVLGAAGLGGYSWFSSAQEWARGRGLVSKSLADGNERNVGWCIPGFDDDPHTGQPCDFDFLPRTRGSEGGGWDGNSEMIMYGATAAILLIMLLILQHRIKAQSQPVTA